MPEATLYSHCKMADGAPRQRGPMRHSVGMASQASVEMEKVGRGPMMFMSLEVSNSRSKCGPKWTVEGCKKSRLCLRYKFCCIEDSLKEWRL